jgi:hypothetical protein
MQHSKLVFTFSPLHATFSFTVPEQSTWSGLYVNYNCITLYWKGKLNSPIHPHFHLACLHTSYSTILFCARSDLFPAKAITMFGLACLWSSLTQFLARPNVSYNVFENMHWLSREFVLKSPQHWVYNRLRRNVNSDIIAESHYYSEITLYLQPYILSISWNYIIAE